jgi:hypothetical protein
MMTHNNANQLGLVNAAPLCPALLDSGFFATLALKEIK